MAVRFLWLFMLLTTIARALEFTQLPKEMVEGGTYEIAWTGAAGNVDLYVKKEDTPSSWRSYICGGGTLCGNAPDEAVNFTVSFPYLAANMTTGRTYVFSAYDSEGSHVSPPIFLGASSLQRRAKIFRA